MGLWVFYAGPFRVCVRVCFARLSSTRNTKTLLEVEHAKQTHAISHITYINSSIVIMSYIIINIYAGDSQCVQLVNIVPPSRSFHTEATPVIRSCVSTERTV